MNHLKLVIAVLEINDHSYYATTMHLITTCFFYLALFQSAHKALFLVFLMIFQDINFLKGFPMLFFCCMTLSCYFPIIKYIQLFIL